MGTRWTELNIQATTWMPDTTKLKINYGVSNLFFENDLETWKQLTGIESYSPYETNGFRCGIVKWKTTNTTQDCPLSRIRGLCYCFQRCPHLKVLGQSLQHKQGLSKVWTSQMSTQAPKPMFSCQILGLTSQNKYQVTGKSDNVLCKITM